MSGASRLRGFLTSVAGLALLFGGWELYVRLADVRRLILPTPSSVFAHLGAEWSFYVPHAVTTLTEAAAGFVAALVIAVVWATAMVHSSAVEKASWPVVVLVQSTPVAALAPVLLIWFGFGPLNKIIIAALFAFVPLVSNALTGLRSLDRDTLEVARSVDASTAEIFWRLRVPQALPALFAAARICVGLALVGAVVGELYGGASGGLGYLARTGQTRGFVDQLWGSIFVLAGIGSVLTLAVVGLERRLLVWHASQD